MDYSHRAVTGVEYLQLATHTLQLQRQGDPTGGMWEAADLQWSWRKDQHDRPTHQEFVLHGDVPVAAVVMTDWGDRFACDLLLPAQGREELLNLVWPVAVGMIEGLNGATVEMDLRQDDHLVTQRATEIGFRPTDVTSMMAWLDAAQRPAAKSVPAGFSLRSRDMVSDRPHHLVARNGSDISHWLGQCSLYDPSLDLVVYGPHEEVACYGLFWADPTTGVGLVEPMRTADAFQHRGLALAVLTSGLERLAARGCNRMKVTYMLDNELSRRLYLGSGFVPTTKCRLYRFN